MKSSRVVLAALIAASPLFTSLRATRADEPGTNTLTVAAQPAEKAAPLPLHQIEGNGGIFSTLSAYIVNPPRHGEPLGRPRVGFAYVSLGHGDNLEALTVTESPRKRLELGYAWDSLGLGDLPLAIKNATGVTLGRSDVQLHNFNARLQLLSEGEFDQKWIPALTFGAHYKNNDGIHQIDQELGGALSAAGLTHHDGTDFRSEERRAGGGGR